MNTNNEKLSSYTTVLQRVPAGPLASHDMINMKFSAAALYHYSV